MCLAIPGKIKRIFKDKQAVIDFMGIKKKVSLDLLEKASPGDFVLVHAGFAINKLNEKEANETIKYLKELTKNN